MGTWGQAGEVAIDVTVLFAPHVFPGAAFCQVGKRGVHGDSLNLWVTLSPLLPGSWCQVLQLRGFSPPFGWQRCVSRGPGQGGAARRPGKGAPLRAARAQTLAAILQLGNHFAARLARRPGPAAAGAQSWLKIGRTARTHRTHAPTVQCGLR